MSDSYYEDHGHEFAQSTALVNLEPLYKPFLDLVQHNGTILDAGCGSGRDIKAFLQKGYSVIAIDSSPVMCKLAEELTGQAIMHCRFQDLKYTDYFDGIWACASLLHVPKAEMSSVLTVLSNALKSTAPLYMSFKHGVGERNMDGRFFCDYTPDSLAEELSRNADLKVLSIWTTNDARTERKSETWVNALCCKI